jgi:hypothetical protein
LSERKDEAHANLGGFFRWPSDRRIKWANDQKFAALKFLLPIGWQEEWIETARGTSDNSLWPAQENSEAFLFDRRVKAADHGAIFSAPEVSGIVTPLKIFGAYYAPGFGLPFVSTDVGAQVTLSGVGNVSRNDSVGGLSDLEFFPVALSWSAFNKDLSVDFFAGIYAPTGGFQSNRLANQGLGYWTFEPGVLVSYLGQKNGFEFSTYIGYDINTENTVTNYLSGQQFHIDATVAQHLPLGKGLIGIGANGFYLQQTTGDSGSGARLGSFEEMTAGVGPVLSYAGQIGKATFAAELKWLPQIGTQNTLDGDYIWFKVGVQF